MQNKPDFIMLPHTADIKIRAYGDSRVELFHNALIGMFQSIQPYGPTCTLIKERVVCTSLSQVRPIHITAPTIDSLLVDFLSEALFLSDIHDEAYFSTSLNIVTDTECKGQLLGTPIDGFSVAEIKAVTYHHLTITHHNNSWEADIIFDI
ncbi:MAG: archease [Candidatus Babeliales bacterium]